jgi:hypothetical protein
MGFSLSWLAVKGKSPQAVREELGFHATGKRQQIPEADLAAAELPGGWYLIVSNRNEQVAADSAMQRLVSACCELVTCFVEEHVMCSNATGWKDGRRSWTVIHDAEHGIEHLVTEGDMPPVFNSIRDCLLSKQRESGGPDAGVDHIFDVPVEVALSLTGYRHDRDIPGMTGEAFEVLTGTAPGDSAVGQKRPLWKRLLGA